MNRYECMLVGGIAALLAALGVLWALMQLVGKILVGVFELIGGICAVLGEIFGGIIGAVAEVFGLAPGWFWSACVMAAAFIGLCYLALRVVHWSAAMRNQAAVVPVVGQNAVIFQNGVAVAVSFDGRRITTKQITPCPAPLTGPEKQILLKMMDRPRRKEIECKGEVAS